MSIYCTTYVLLIIPVKVPMYRTGTGGLPVQYHYRYMSTTGIGNFQSFLFNYRYRYCDLTKYQIGNKRAFNISIVLTVFTGTSQASTGRQATGTYRYHYIIGTSINIAPYPYSTGTGIETNWYRTYRYLPVGLVGSRYRYRRQPTGTYWYLLKPARARAMMRGTGTGRLGLPVSVSCLNLKHEVSACNGTRFRQAFQCTPCIIIFLLQYGTGSLMVVDTGTYLPTSN